MAVKTLQAIVMSRTHAYASGFRFLSRRKESLLPDTKAARAPYGLGIVESCLSYPHREDRLFCDLSPAPAQALAAITSAAVYPKGATLLWKGSHLVGSSSCALGELSSRLHLLTETR
jgi:hypothetical protein